MVFLLLLRCMYKWGDRAKNLKMVSFRYFNPLISKQLKNLFRVFHKIIFKCSKINELRNFVFPF